MNLVLLRYGVDLNTTGRLFTVF